MRLMNTKRLIPLLSLFTLCTFLGFNILLHHDIYSIESSFLEEDDYGYVEEGDGVGDRRNRHQQRQQQQSQQYNT